MGVGIFVCLGNEGLRATTFSVDVALDGLKFFTSERLDSGGRYGQVDLEIQRP